MGPTTQIVCVAATVALAAILIAIVLWVYDRVFARFRRPRTVDLSPGMYWFRDGKFEDGRLEWRPVSELFR